MKINNEQQNETKSITTEGKFSKGFQESIWFFFFVYKIYIYNL